MPWTLDKEALTSHVVQAVQRGWNPGENLFRVYQLAPDVEDEDLIRTALEGVRQALVMGKGFDQSRSLLIERHPDAARLMLDPTARRRHRDEVRARHQELVAELRNLLGGGPALPRAQLQQSVELSRFRHSLPEAIEAVRRAGGDEREPLDLPPAAERPTDWQQIVTLLPSVRAVPDQARQPLWAYLALLHGVRTTEQDLAERRLKLRTSRDSSRTAEENLIKILQRHLDAGSLRGLLAHEAIDTVRSAASYGWSAARAAAEQVRPLLLPLGVGLGPDDLAYAVWCQVKFSANAGSAWMTEAENLLSAGDLRAALALLEARPGLPAAWERKRVELTARIQQLSQEIDAVRRLERDEPEQAARRYQALLAESSDQRLRDGLARCRPAAPAVVRAEFSAGDVVISWSPSTAEVGRISYRVVRGRDRFPLDPSDGEVVGDPGTGTRVVDRGPPVATDLLYAVFTLRDDSCASPGRTARLPARLPDVDQLAVVADVRGARLRWRTPPGAAGVVISRGPVIGDPRSSDATWPDTFVEQSSFLDGEAEPGSEHVYYLRVRYGDSATGARYSPGVSIRAGRHRIPAAVEDLEVTSAGDELRLRWSPPPAGRVDILLVTESEPLPRGMVPANEQDRRQALELQGDPAAGHAGAVHPRHLRGYWLVPTTVLGSLAAVGAGVRVDGVLASVGDLRATVRGTQTQLTWEWPQSAAQVVVLWRAGARPEGPGDPAARQQVISRSAYAAQGCRITGLQGHYCFAVATTSTSSGRIRYGGWQFTDALITGEARFTIRTRWWMPRWRRVTVFWDAAEPLPPVQIRVKDGIRPRAAGDGNLLARLPSARSLQSIALRLPSEIRHPHINVFSDDPAVVVVPASPTAVGPPR
jgi:hypothetical protein